MKAIYLLDIFTEIVRKKEIHFGNPNISWKGGVVIQIFQ